MKKNECCWKEDCKDERFEDYDYCNKHLQMSELSDEERLFKAQAQSVKGYAKRIVDCTYNKHKEYNSLTTSVTHTFTDLVKDKAVDLIVKIRDLSEDEYL